MSRLVRALMRAALAGLLAPLWCSAQAAPTVATIVEGPATLIRDTTRFALVEGVRLQPGDIVHTADTTRLVRLELADGGYANLGPTTQLLLGPRVPDKLRKPAPLYLLSGWLKTASPVMSPAADVTEPQGPVVVALQPAGLQVFSETTAATVVERRAGASPVALKSGQLFERLGQARAATLPRPTPAFLQQLPPPFLDTLPARAELFKAREVKPKPLGEVTYDDIAGWLAAEPALRRALQPRWTPLARQAEFRKALAARLSAHPEWERTLFPERFQPPAASAPAAGTTGAGYRATP